MSAPGKTRPDIPTLAAAIVIVFVTVWILVALLHTSFFSDEWDVLLHRRGNAPSDFLRPHNDHLYVIPVAIYKTLMATFGLRTYLPYLAAMLAVHAALSFTVFVIVRRYVNVVAGACGAAMVLLMGRGSIDFVWAFQIGFLLSITAGMWAFLALERPGRRRDVIASTCLVVAIASSGLGIPLLVAVAARLAIDRASWRRWWVLVPPALLYGAWYLAWGASTADAENVRLAPSYVGRAAAGAVGGLFGCGGLDGRVIVGFGVTLVLVVLIARRAISPGAVLFGVWMVAFWGVTALSRAQLNDPDSGRYIFVGGVLTVVFAATLWDRRPVPTLASAVLVVVALGALYGNVPSLRDHIQGQRNEATFARAQLGALLLVREDAPDSFQPDPERFPPQLTAASYLDAVDEMGSDADSPAVIATRSPSVRSAADWVIARVIAANATVEPLAGACPDGTTPWAPTAYPSQLIGNAGQGPATVDLQYFADGVAGVIEIAPGDAVRITLPAAIDASEARLSGAGDRVTC